MRVGVVNIGLGNVNSVARALAKLGVEVDLVSDPAGLASTEKIVFPGVGSYGEAVAKITCSGIREAIREEVLANKKPILGICLGMQLLARQSEEGEGLGLDFIPAEITLLKAWEQGLSQPHVGWNDVCHGGMEMFHGIPENTSFYFVHSYAMDSAQVGCKIATCDYGGTFAAAVQQGNIWGAQFHPEKSQQAGLKLLQNFIAYQSHA
jgi:glutamine amidotransferase